MPHAPAGRTLRVRRPEGAGVEALHMTGRAMGTAAALLGLCLCGACASTKLAQVWKAPQPGPPVKKVLVVAVVPQPQQQRTLEGEFVELLKARGVQAAPGHALAPEGKPLDRAGVEELVRREGFDAVLVSRYAGTSTTATYVPGGHVGDPTGMGFYGYYDALYPTVYAPGALVQNETVNVETMLYRSEGKGELVWSTTSETFNPTSPYSAIEDIGAAVVERMSKDKVIADGG